MMRKPTTPDEIRERAAALVEEHDGDIDAASRAMGAWIMEAPERSHLLCRMMIRTLVRSELGRERRQIAGGRRREVPEPKPDDTRGLRTGARTAATRWLDFPLPVQDGRSIRLGEARKADLVAAIAAYRQTADSNARRAAFLEAVADTLERKAKGADRRVTDCLTETQLRQLAGQPA